MGCTGSLFGFCRALRAYLCNNIKSYIDQIANGEPSTILVAEPLTEFIRRQIEGLDNAKGMYLLFVMPELETPCGIKARLYTTSSFLSSSMQNYMSKHLITPVEIILCLNTNQSMYCQLLIGLLQREQVSFIGSIFASAFARCIKFLQDHWEEICSNIRTGHLSDWITEPACKNPTSSILSRPNPELADFLEQTFENKSWEGIIRKLWPNAKFVDAIVTGFMSQYVSLLDFYCGGLPLVSPSYNSSEACFGVNLKPLSKPSDVSYTFLPHFAYFEFLPVDNGNVEPVDLVNVKVGQCYEVVVTTSAGLYRYRVGDVLKVTGFHNNSPQFQFVERQNVVLSVDWDKTSEADLLKAIANAKVLLDQLGFVLSAYSSYADTSSTPGRYVLFWELKTKATNDFPKLDAKIMEECCCIVEESLDFTYKSLRQDNKIAPLELRVVKPGTFDALMDFYISKGSPISQYKTLCCLKSEEAISTLNAGVIGKFFSPKTLP